MHEAGHPKPVYRDNPVQGGEGGGGGRGIRFQGTHVHLWPIHTDIRQNQHNIVIIFQLK